ncbi:MAG: hypothetical protein E4H14_13190 [Candidatus Thorarchaeota archaeon]|nr:MAG: hypothetical protein E4H14_13190 [Candidatus Thorarchaeota archaeon]
MNPETQATMAISDFRLKLIATIFFLIQILLFFLYYNFMVDVYVLGMGWLLLFPGLILVILSARDQDGQQGKSSGRRKRIKQYSRYSMHFGWSIISLSLAFIIQQWFTYFIAIGFVSIMILDIRRERLAKQNASLMAV